MDWTSVAATIGILLVGVLAIIGASTVGVLAHIGLDWVRGKIAEEEGEKQRLGVMVTRCRD